ncbi:MAG TPA: YceI family protein [Chryseosolibacter sp.]
MLRNYCLTGFLAVFAFLVHGQQKYSIEKGKINFTSNAQLELIKASSDGPQGLLDPATNQFAFTIDIKTFQGFNSALQREHFNEKYMESEKFPRARFSGKIIESVDFTTNGTFDVRAKGDLEIHGIKQTRIIKSKLTIKDGLVEIESRFIVPLSDHNITIPNIVSQKIATEIEVEFRATMKPR